jgi:hypothetical protein
MKKRENNNERRINASVKNSESDDTIMKKTTAKT